MARALCAGGLCVHFGRRRGDGRCGHRQHGGHGRPADDQRAAEKRMPGKRILLGVWVTRETPDGCQMCGFKSYELQPNTGTVVRDIVVKGLRFCCPRPSRKAAAAATASATRCMPPRRLWTRAHARASRRFCKLFPRSRAGRMALPALRSPLSRQAVPCASPAFFFGAAAVCRNARIVCTNVHFCGVDSVTKKRAVV